MHESGAKTCWISSRSIASVKVERPRFSALREATVIHGPMHAPALLRADWGVVAGVPVAEFLKLAGYQVDHGFAIAFACAAAMAVAPAQLLPLLVQVSHSWLLCFSSSCRSVAPGYPYVVAGVLISDKCFCPYRTPGRCGNYKGHGTPLPLCAEVFLLAAAARGIGTDGDCCCKSVHRVEPLSQGSGCARWRLG